MAKRVYNRESAAQVLQRTEWMTAGWINSALSAVINTQRRRKGIIKQGTADWYLEQARDRLAAAASLMREEEYKRKVEQKTSGKAS